MLARYVADYFDELTTGKGECFLFQILAHTSFSERCFRKVIRLETL